MEKQPKDKVNLYLILISKIKQLKSFGYHIRFSNSTFYSDDKKFKCDCCKFPTNIGHGYEKDYPQNPDIWLCPKYDNLYKDIE